MKTTVEISIEELERLKAKNRAQAREITLLKDVLARKNIDLDAMHFVWCDGGCPGGVHRFITDSKLTEDMIVRAERNVKRLRKWYNTVKARYDQYSKISEWHDHYLQSYWTSRAASKTDLVV